MEEEDVKMVMLRGPRAALNAMLQEFLSPERTNGRGNHVETRVIGEAPPPLLESGITATEVIQTRKTAVDSLEEDTTYAAVVADVSRRWNQDIMEQLWGAMHERSCKALLAIAKKSPEWCPYDEAFQAAGVEHSRSAGSESLGSYSHLRGQRGLPDFIIRRSDDRLYLIPPFVAKWIIACAKELGVEDTVSERTSTEPPIQKRKYVHHAK